MEIEENCERFAASTKSKFLYPELDTAADEMTIYKFRNELKLALKIAHRNVCKMDKLSGSCTVLKEAGMEIPCLLTFKSD